jgi:hypothetical protein
MGGRYLSLLSIKYQLTFKEIMKMYQKILLLLTIAVVMFGCATTTQVRKSWSDPSLAKGTVKPFNKVFVFVTLRNDASRRIAEDKIVAGVKNGTAVQSYTYLTPADTSQKLLVERLKKNGFDGVITMRVKAVVNSNPHSPPRTSAVTWYSTSYVNGYVYTSSSADYIPPPEEDNPEQKNYIVETNIYSLESNMLLWSGVTASINPKKIDQAMDGIINTIKTELKKKGLIK